MPRLPRSDETWSMARANVEVLLDGSREPQFSEKVASKRRRYGKWMSLGTQSVTEQRCHVIQPVQVPMDIQRRMIVAGDNQTGFGQIDGSSGRRIISSKHRLFSSLLMGIPVAPRDRLHVLPDLDLDTRHGGGQTPLIWLFCKVRHVYNTVAARDLTTESTESIYSNWRLRGLPGFILSGGSR